jgi:hypothetical protein
MDLDRVLHNLSHHAPQNPGVVSDFAVLRLAFKDMAEDIYRICPGSRERSLAITALEEACMWAIAAVARNQNLEEGD